MNIEAVHLGRDVPVDCVMHDDGFRLDFGQVTVYLEAETFTRLRAAMMTAAQERTLVRSHRRVVEL